MELEECIKDAFDDSMQTYVTKEEYINEQKDIDERVQALRESLGKMQQSQLNELLNAISNSNAMMAAEAYMRGVVQGIALRGKVLEK